MRAEPIYLERDGAVAQLVLNRPDKRNALTEAMWEAIPALLKEAAADAALRVLIVRGEGGAFAAGADIGEFEEVYATRERAAAYSQKIARALDSVAGFPLPTLARIEGACVGGGCGLALACDLRYAATGSRFGITPGKLGLAYTLNDTKRLMDAVGPSAAKDILFTGRLIDAEQAIAIGLIDRAVSPEELDPTVTAFTDAVSAASSHSARVSKQIIQMVLSGVHQDTAETRALFLDAFQGLDFKEGYRAFMEKRRPDFSSLRRS
jgi:enoyl-CoA hydratase/carnithine racemase